MIITKQHGNEHRARITSQGQITVPKAVREALGAGPGSVLEFERAGDAFLMRYRRRPSVLEFAGIASDAAGRLPETAQGIDRMIQDGMAAEAAARMTRRRRRDPPR